MKSLKDILAEGVAVSSDFKLVNSVDSQGRPTTRKVRAHRKTISPKKDDSEDKPDVLTSIQKFVGRQYDEEVEQVDELKKSTLASYAKKAGDESSYYSFAAGSRSVKDPERLKSDKLAMKRQSGVNKAIDRLAKEEVELDEVSTDGYHKAAVKSRMDAAVKVMSSMGSDKQAKTKLDARNKGLQRLSDRTSTEMKKANSGPQKPSASNHDGNDRGYGKGRYMGDSYELLGQVVEGQSPSMRMFKALQKIKQQREQDDARKKENEKRALTPVKEQTYDESNPKIKAALDKFRNYYTDKTPSTSSQDKPVDPKKYMSTDSGAAGNPDEYDADSFKPSNPAWKKRQAQAEQYAGSGQSKDMQRAVDAAHRDAERKMMRDMHGNSYQDKPIPEHDNSTVDISSDGKGGYSASVTKTPKSKPQAAATNEAKK